MSANEEFMALIKQIQESPGQQITNEIESIKASLRTVKMNYDELTVALKAFQSPEAIPALWALRNRPAMSRALEDLTRRLTNFLSSAFRLVDHMRRHRRSRYKGTEFAKEIQHEIYARFKDDNDHRIASGLRNIALHYSVIPTAAEMTYSPGNGESHGFKIQVKTLLGLKRWKAGDRLALKKLGPTIDIAEFANRYFKKIEAFYLWLWKRQAEIHAPELQTSNKLRERARERYKQTHGGKLRMNLD